MSIFETGTIFAHGGGWDELLYFVVPVIAAIAAIRWATSRSRKAGRPQAEDPEDAGADVSR